jgi:hypothetical protein
MTDTQKRDVLEMILLAKQLKMKPKDVVAVFQKKYEGQEQPDETDLMQSIKQWWSWYGK